MSDLKSLPSVQPHSLSSPNMTRSSGFISFNNRDPKNMTFEELEEEYQRLREENHQLQLRILGVNELARLLQDKNETVQMVQEKNKRLEVAVVRLENRCANIEKMSKLQQRGGGASLQSKTGQSPFVPGPSRQILEGLMRENSELKKTVNNLTRKGASGYLEAVKITQLEEVIDCQKEELQFQREQIKSLTDSGEADKSGGLSLPGHVSETGPLKRQLIKSQHAMKVKDRFCALLSQQIAELQSQLKLAQRQIDETSEQSKSHESVSGGGNPVEESTPPGENPHKAESNTTDLESKYKKIFEDQKSEIEKLREEHATTLEKLEKIQRDLKQKSRQTEDLEKERDRLTNYHQTILSEKEELTQTLQLAQKDLEMFMPKGSEGVDQSDGSVSREAYRKLERESMDLQKVLEDEMNQHSEQRRNYDTEITVLKTQIEDAETKTAMAKSELDHHLNLHGQERSELNRKIEDQEQKVLELYDDVDALKSENRELKMGLSETKMNLGFVKTGQTRYGMPTDSSGVGPGLTPRETGLIYGNQSGLITVRDGTSGENRGQNQPIGSCEKAFAQAPDFRQSVMSRNPEVKRPNYLPPGPAQTYMGDPYKGRVSPSRQSSPYSGQHRPPTTPSGQPFIPGQQQPIPRVTGGQMLQPGANYPPQHMRGMNQPVFQRTPSAGGNPPTQISGLTPTPGSPYRSHTQPISMATSPTSFGMNPVGRQGYPSQQMGGAPSQQPHPLTTTSAMYSQGGVTYSGGGARMGQQPNYPLQPGHTFHPHPDDETSIPGGQRSPSPNPYGGSQHR